MPEGSLAESGCEAERRLSISSNDSAVVTTPPDSSHPTVSDPTDQSHAPEPASTSDSPAPDLGPAEGAGPCPQSESRGRSLGEQRDSMIPAPQLTYLDRVVTEIIETERTYVRDLRMIVEDYLADIIERSELRIRPEQVCFLFGNIEDIYEFNSELLQDLDQSHKDPVAVARCFVSKSEHFEIYTQYCNNYPNSVAALTECMGNQCLAKFFRERQEMLKRPLPLGSFLLKPVQRILKYHLLLQEIAKHFDPEDPGFDVVEEALAAMTGVAWYINDMKRKHEHAVRLQEVQSLLLDWKGPDLTTYGELVLEGTFKVHRAKHQRTLFLLDRVLLITKRRGEHYVYKTHISCSTLMLIENPKDSLSFGVTHYRRPKQPHTVQTKSVEEKKQWAHQIKRIILENHQAVIPQKAKDAILEMDSIYATQRRFSPEHPKKRFKQDRRGLRRSGPIRPTPTYDADVQSKEPEGGVVLPLDSTAPEEPGGKVPVSEQTSAEELLQEEEPQSEPTENPEPESLPEAEGRFVSESEELEPEGGPELSVKPDSKTVSSAESSDEEDQDDSGLETSILPSSVLDQACAIAQHVSGSIRRRGSVQDRTPSQGSTSPCLPSQSVLSSPVQDQTPCPGPVSSRLPSQTIPTCEPVDRTSRLNSVRSDLSEAFLEGDLTQQDHLRDLDSGARQRRDSTLSTQDQLLIGKIKSYYETAENQDAAFRLQRRESLTYIPTGLVRSSVTRLNSVSTDEPVFSDPSTASGGLHPPTEPLLTGPSETCDRTGAESLDSDHRGANPKETTEASLSRSQSLPQSSFQDEEFRSSSEMIKIWQAMEQDLIKPQKVADPPRIPREPRAEASGFYKNQNQTCNPKGTESTLSTTSQGSLIPKSSSSVSEAAVPHRAGGDPVQVDHVDTTKSKVLNLARQYSQRIKTSKPVVRQRSQDLLKTILPSVVEETEAPGKQATSLDPKHQTSLTSGPEELIQAPNSDSFGLLRPSVAVEVFSWPDVQELRSKYSDQKGTVQRSQSLPEKMLDGGLGNTSSHSSDLLPEDQVKPGSDGGQEEPASSLDQKVDSSSGRFFIAAEMPLAENPEHKIIILEKVPEPESEPAEPALKSITEEEEEEEDCYVQIRSPTSREKISMMAVIDRCRAYQDSQESKPKEEPKTTSESLQEPDKTSGPGSDQNDPTKIQGPGPQPDQDGPPEPQQNLVKSLSLQEPDKVFRPGPDQEDPTKSQPNLVKNLREKFQSLS